MKAILACANRVQPSQYGRQLGQQLLRLGYRFFHLVLVENCPPLSNKARHRGAQRRLPIATNVCRFDHARTITAGVNRKSGLSVHPAVPRQTLGRRRGGGQGSDFVIIELPGAGNAAIFLVQPARQGDEGHPSSK
jgi:hypothetical protein